MDWMLGATENGEKYLDRGELGVIWLSDFVQRRGRIAVQVAVADGGHEMLKASV